MKYTTDGSSNMATNGQNINLSIRINKEDGLNKIPFAIKGGKKIQISNLNTIVSSENLSIIKCHLESSSGSSLQFANNQTDESIKFIKKRNYFKKSSYLEIKITGCKAQLSNNPSFLKISFYDKDTSEKVDVDFPVYQQQEPLEITSFKAVPSVIQADDNRKKIQFNWTIKGNCDTQTVKEGSKVTNITNGSMYLPDSGDHNYTLEVKRGANTVTETIKVRVLKSSDFYSDANPQSFLIGNFCVGQHSNILYSLMLEDKRDEKNILISHVGYSDDPLLGNWSKFNLLEADKEKLKPFVTSPMVHLKNDDEVYGRLFFIGGSYLGKNEDFDGSANKLAIVDLEKGTEELKVTIKNVPWGKRWAHSCAMYPKTIHSKGDAIWLLGGMDEFGNALNDIWTSEDGENWNKMVENAPWSSRCMAGVAVELDKNNKKNAIWFGGGFKGIDGENKTDIWKYENGQWEEIKDLQTKNNSYSFGLAYVGKDSINATGIYTIGSYPDSANQSKNIFQRISSKNKTYSYNDLGGNKTVKGLSTNDDSYIITGFFKGCMWYLVFTDKGDSGTSFSKLFYWVPEVTARTLIYS